MTHFKVHVANVILIAIAVACAMYSRDPALAVSMIAMFVWLK